MTLNCVLAVIYLFCVMLPDCEALGANYVKVVKDRHTVSVYENVVQRIQFSAYD